jgi:hypothetical protein
LADPKEQITGNPKVDAYARRLIDAAAQARLPELFADRSRDPIYRVPNRHGVGVVLLRTRELGEELLVQLMKYRLAQYLSTQFVDARMVYETRMEHEPLANVLPDDIHAVAGCPDGSSVERTLVS